MKGKEMPLYKYSCSKCGMKVEIIRKLSERDNLHEIRKMFCDNIKYKVYLDEKSEAEECPLQRDVTSGSFKI